MLSSTAYGRNIIPPHICYSIIAVQMIDFLVNCISAPYIIKICDFVALWNEDNIRRELSFLYKIYTVSKKCVLRVSIPTVFCCCVPRFALKFGHISKVKIWIAADRSVSPHLAKWLANSFFNFDNIDDRIDLSDLVLNFVILNNLSNNRLSSIQ
jgi:hypothetical protein